MEVTYHTSPVTCRAQPAPDPLRSSALRREYRLLRRRQGLDAGQPCREVPAFRPHAIQADPGGHRQAVLNLAVTA